MSLLEPIRIALLFDYVADAKEGGYDTYPDVRDTLAMVVEPNRDYERDAVAREM